MKINSLEEHQILLFFDENCELCSKFIQFISKKDKKKIFLFAPLQGETSKKHLDLKDIQNLSSIVVYKENKLYREGQALKLISRNLYPYRSFLLIITPSFLVNRIYHFIAKRRYHLFGKRNEKSFPSHLRKSLLP